MRHAKGVRGLVMSAFIGLSPRTVALRMNERSGAKRTEAQTGCEFDSYVALISRVDRPDQDSSDFAPDHSSTPVSCRRPWFQPTADHGSKGTEQE
jgi:hypothetical protein